MKGKIYQTEQFSFFSGFILQLLTSGDLLRTAECFNGAVSINLRERVPSSTKSGDLIPLPKDLPKNENEPWAEKPVAVLAAICRDL